MVSNVKELEIKKVEKKGLNSTEMTFISDKLKQANEQQKKYFKEVLNGDR